MSMSIVEPEVLNEETQLSLSVAELQALFEEAQPSYFQGEMPAGLFVVASCSVTCSGDQSCGTTCQND